MLPQLATRLNRPLIGHAATIAAASILAAMASFEWIERPLLRLRKPQSVHSEAPKRMLVAFHVRALRAVES